MANATADLLVHGGGSVYLLFSVSSIGDRWIAEHLPDDALRLGHAVAVEHRYIRDIVEGAIRDGLVVR